MDNDEFHDEGELQVRTLIDRDPERVFAQWHDGQWRIMTRGVPIQAGDQTVSTFHCSICGDEITYSTRWRAGLPN